MAERSDAQRDAICAVVLAAGQSRRMGRQKLLLPLPDGELIVRQVVRTALSVPQVTRVCVVVADPDPGVGRALRGLPVDVVANPAADSGMSTSLQAGVRYVQQAGGTAMLVLLGDMPRVPGSVLGAVAQRFLDTRQPIVQARYRGAWGHPVLFGASLFDELLSVQGDQGGRSVVAYHPADRAPVDIDAPSPADVDTPADYARL